MYRDMHVAWSTRYENVDSLIR